MNMVLSKSKKKVFFLIMIIPLLLIIIFTISFYNFYNDFDSFSKEICNNDEINQGKLNDFEEYSTWLNNLSLPKRHIEIISKKLISFNDSENFFLVFGESTPVFMGEYQPFKKIDINDPAYYDISRYPELEEKFSLNLFPNQLSSRLNNMNFENLAITGSFSFQIKNNLFETLNELNHKPNFILFYYGHNDYFIPELYIFLNSLNRNNLFKKIMTKIDFFKEENSYKGFLYLFRKSIEYNLINYDINCFTEMESIVYENYRKNTIDIVNKLTQENISAIFITPISNLEYIFENSNADYINLFNDYDYKDKIKIGFELRDKYFFGDGSHVRSEFNDFLRTIENQNKDIYTFDLENKLIDNNFSFSYNNFDDSQHFNKETHKIVGNMLYEFIINQGII